MYYCTCTPLSLPLPLPLSPSLPLSLLYLPKESSTSPLLGSLPLTLPLQLKGMSSSAGYAYFYSKIKTNKNHKIHYVHASTYHVIIVHVEKHLDNQIPVLKEVTQKSCP